jgi:hypothetical protein
LLTEPDLRRFAKKPDQNDFVYTLGHALSTVCRRLGRPGGTQPSSLPARGQTQRRASVLILRYSPEPFLRVDFHPIEATPGKVARS